MFIYEMVQVGCYAYVRGAYRYVPNDKRIAGSDLPS